MAELNLNARMLTRADTFANWTSKNPLLKKGEIATVIIEGDSGNTILFKIGDGTTKFNSLDWAKATASDVYDWAKAESKPTYTSTEVGAVSYTSQTLTDAQKTQARENIGALSATADTEEVSTLGILKSITASATDNDVPTAKAVYNYVSAQTGADSTIYTAIGINPPASGNFYLGASSSPAYRAYVKETYSDRVVPYTGTEVKVGSYDNPFTFASGKLTADTSSSTAITATGVDNFTLNIPNKLASPTSSVYRYSTMTFTTQLSGGPKGTSSATQSLIWGCDTAVTASLRPASLGYNESLGTSSNPWYQLYLGKSTGVGIKKLGVDRSGLSSEVAFTDVFLIEHLSMSPSQVSGSTGTGTIDLMTHGAYNNSGTTKTNTGGLRISTVGNSTSTNNVSIIPIFSVSNTITGTGNSYFGTTSNPWNYAYVGTVNADKLYNKANSIYRRVPVFWGNGTSSLPSTDVTTGDMCYIVDAVSSNGSTKTYVRPKIYYSSWRDTEADYIVDQSLSGSTRWVKWASGRLEQWLFIWKGTVKDTDWSAWGSSGLYYYDITNTSWPVAFSTSHNGTTIDITPITTMNAYAGDAILWVKASNVTATTLPKISLVGPANMTRYNVRIDIHATGYWK